MKVANKVISAHIDLP